MSWRYTIGRVLFSVIASALIGAPLALFAQISVDPTTDVAYKAGYVPCGQTRTVYDTSGKMVSQDIPNPCDFPDILELARRLITGWIMAAVIIGTMGFAYAGYLYMTAMGSEEKIKHAHSIFYKVALGIAFMLAAWLIAYTLEQTFLTPEQQGRSFLKKFEEVNIDTSVPADRSVDTGTRSSTF